MLSFQARSVSCGLYRERMDTMAPEAGTICFTWMTWGWPFLLNPILKTTWAPSSNWIIADCTSHRIQLPSSWHYPEPVAQAQLGKGETAYPLLSLPDTARNPHLGSFWNHFLATVTAAVSSPSTNVASTNCGIWSSWDRIIIFGSRRVWIHPHQSWGFCQHNQGFIVPVAGRCHDHISLRRGCLAFLEDMHMVCAKNLPESRQQQETQEKYRKNYCKMINRLDLSDSHQNNQEKYGFNG